MNILRIALNDLRRMFKDKMLIFWWLIMPLGFVYMFALLMGGERKNTTWLPIFNHDKHELSTLFIDQLKADGYNIDLRKKMHEENHVQYWSRAIIIPATFSESILKGETAQFEFVKGKGNAENTLSAQARLIFNLVKFNGALATVDVINNRWTNLTRDKFVEELNKPQQLSVKNMQHNALRPPPVGFALTLPGYLVMFVLMISIMYGGVTLAIERRYKQLTRLIAAPVSSMEIFIGKLLARMLQPALQSTMMILCGHYMFGVSLGDHPLILIPVLACFSYFCGTLGVLFGTVFSTEKQISSVGIMVTQILCALGGCWWPIEIVPETFRKIAMCTPTYWALQALQDVMAFGKTLSGVMPECLCLLALGTVLLLISIPLFERQKRGVE